MLNKCFLLESPHGPRKRLFTLGGREGTASHAPEMKPVQGVKEQELAQGHLRWTSCVRDLHSQPTDEETAVQRGTHAASRPQVLDSSDHLPS